MLFCFPVNFVFAIFADDAVQMINIVFVYIFDAKIMDDLRERNISGFVTEEAFGVFGFDIVMFCEMFDETIVSDAS